MEPLQISLQSRFKAEGMVTTNVTLYEKMTYQELCNRIGARSIMLNGYEIPPNRDIVKSPAVVVFFDKQISKEEFLKRCSVVNSLAPPKKKK